MMVGLVALMGLAYLWGKATMGVVSRKDSSVDLNGLAPEGYTILGAIERATRIYGVNLVITSASRPDDSDSQHSVGKALDVRTAGLTNQQIVDLYHWFIVELGPRYAVLYEVPSLMNLPDSLRAIAFVNAHASAPHFHLGARRT